MIFKLAFWFEVKFKEIEQSKDMWVRNISIQTQNRFAYSSF